MASLAGTAVVPVYGPRVAVRDAAGSPTIAGITLVITVIQLNRKTKNKFVFVAP